MEILMINNNIIKDEDNMHNEHMTDDEITTLLIDVISAVKERLLKELVLTFGSDPNYKIESEELNKLKYCEAVIKE
ncbi:17315_t:CDS:2, partial [Cetraspora pellucida]